jgi:type I restriction enzyme, S subunit
VLSNLVKQGMTVQSLEYEKFENQLFPFPPLKEQVRIVQKVEELIRLCAKLEKRIEENQIASELLMETVLKKSLKRNQLV